jgi:2-iminobutanoate/2-iminopropanoate deaminase
MIKKLTPADNLPYSKAVIHDSKYTLEVSGQIGVDPKTGNLAEGVEAQAKCALENIRTALERVGWTFDNVIKARIYLTDMKDYSAVNAVYKEFFSNGYPARVALAVQALPLSALIEIECTAAGDNFRQ